MKSENFCHGSDISCCYYQKFITVMWYLDTVVDFSIVFHDYLLLCKNYFVCYCLSYIEYRCFGGCVDEKLLYYLIFRYFTILLRHIHPISIAKKVYLPIQVGINVLNSVLQCVYIEHSGRSGDGWNNLCLVFLTLWFWNVSCCPYSTTRINLSLKGTIRNDEQILQCRRHVEIPWWWVWLWSMSQFQL